MGNAGDTLFRRGEGRKGRERERERVREKDSIIFLSGSQAAPARPSDECRIKRNQSARGEVLL